MKRWTRRLIVAALTFALGCGIYFFAGRARVLYWRTLGPLPYCEVARNAEHYHNTDILVRARVILSGSAIYVYEDCDPVEALAAGVEFEGNNPLLGPEYVDNLLVTGEHPQVKTAEALIEGRFDAEASPGCWAPKFRINAKRIELLSDITDYVPPHSDQEGVRVKH